MNTSQSSLCEQMFGSILINEKIKFERNDQLKSWECSNKSIRKSLLFFDWVFIPRRWENLQSQEFRIEFEIFLWIVVEKERNCCRLKYFSNGGNYLFSAKCLSIKELSEKKSIFHDIDDEQNALENPFD